MSLHSDIIIIGSGMAGYTLLREIRKIDTSKSITLICRDSADFYSKPMLSNALDKNKTPQQLVMQSAQQMVDTLNFELVNHTEITAIDTNNRQINSHADGWSYHDLVLATGANPVKLPIQRDAAQDILSINNLDDYRTFYQKQERASSIAIIGPGLIGCEFANDLLKLQKKITIIGPDRWPISNLLPQQTGEFLQHKFQQQGIQFKLQNTVSTVTCDNTGLRLSLQDGDEVEADLVLSAVGLRANLDLAKNTGLETARGYSVDRLLQTNIENIYALGDCAEVEGLHLPYILPIMQSARALARTLTGTPTQVSYPAMPVAIKTPACPLVVSPPAVSQPEWEVSQSADGVKALCYQQQDLLGFALAGDAVLEKQALVPQLPAQLQE